MRRRLSRAPPRNSSGQSHGKRQCLKSAGACPPRLVRAARWTLWPKVSWVRCSAYPVIGVGAATKELQQFLHCTKDYRATGLLGSATSSYDCKDAVVYRAPSSQVTEALIREKLPLFTGEVQQIPPLYSALRMDGKRLFEYAREGIPLPRPIEARDVTVHELRLVEWLPEDKHTYRAPDMEVSEEYKQVYERMRKIAGRDHTFDTTKPAASDGAEATEGAEQPKTENAEPESKESTSAEASADAPASEHPAAFTLEMTVSSGTYVRSIIHDLGAACGSAAHVVRLIRTRQGQFSLGHGPVADGASVEDSQVSLPGNCIPWSVFEQGLAELEAARKGTPETKDDEGLREWERVLLSQYVYMLLTQYPTCITSYPDVAAQWTRAICAAAPRIAWRTAARPPTRPAGTWVRPVRRLTGN